MSGIRMQWDGMDKVLRGLAATGAQAAQLVAHSLNEEAQLVWRESQRQAPYDTGVMRGSGRLHPARVTGDRIEIEMTYGGEGAEYAIFVHEIPKNYNHGKKDHYLSDPLEAAAPQMGDRVAARLERKLRERLG